jgi:branched-chain amino acid transport system substrate-binding protein
MPRRQLARRLALAGCACVILAAAVGGCTTTASSSSVSGGTLSIYMSEPPGSLTPETQDVLAAERLALQQSGTHIGKFTLKLVPFQAEKLSDNARQAIGDGTTIAYLGEIAPGASADTLGITNAEDVLQVSPTDTAVEVTQATGAIPKSPDKYYESLSSNGRTFARVVPTDALEARALVSQMQSLGVNRLYIPGDGSEYGRALRSEVVKRASPGITVVSAAAGADGVLYAGSSLSAAAAAFNSAAAGNPAVKLFGSSALAQDALVAALSPQAQRNLYVSEPGFTSSDLPPLGRQFVSAFRTAYGHDPSTQAIFGYAAMAALLHVLQEAGSSAANRGTVVHGFFGIRNLNSVVGTYSIDKNGDTSIAPFVISRVQAGKLVPYKAVSEQG